MVINTPKKGVWILNFGHFRVIGVKNQKKRALLCVERRENLEKGAFFQAVRPSFLI